MNAQNRFRRDVTNYGLIARAGQRNAADATLDAPLGSKVPSRVPKRREVAKSLSF